MKKQIAFFYIITSLLPCLRQTNAQETAGGAANPFAQAKFVPDISLVMDASYVHRNHRNAGYNGLLLPGFSRINTINPMLDHESMNVNQGFNLNYAELVVFSVVDPYFDLFINFDFSEDGVDIEEAYFTTRRLAWGLQVKGGRFLSHFGRINAQHTHQWDFCDAPLIYGAVFGESMLNEKGIRLTWVAPLDTYIMLGGEISQGENASSFGCSGFSDAGGAVSVRESNGPNLGVAYVKTSFDYENLTFLLGVSYASGMTRLNQGLEKGVPQSQADYGRTHIAGADMTVKYLFDSIRSLSFQAEYLLRNSSGDHYQINDGGSTHKNSFEKQQGGFYAQITGRFSKRLRLGLRCDLIHLNDIQLDHVKQDYPESLPRYSAMAEYNPTEFSRLRLQYNHDQRRYTLTSSGYGRKSNRELVLQINLAIGAHGAHAY